MLYCNICDETINIICDETSKSKHVVSNSHKHKEKYSILVEVYEFASPDINQIFSIIKNFARDCHKKYFHSFTFKCIYDIEMRNGDCVNEIISDEKSKTLFDKMVLFIN